MFITGGLTKIDQLPQPSMGLLPAVHSTQATEISVVDGAVSLPTVTAAAGILYKNATGLELNLPAQGGFPIRSISPNEYFSSNGVAFYKLRNKPGLTRQVISVVNGVFTMLEPHQFTNGETVKLYGFVNPTATINGVSSSFSDTGVTFRIAESSGNSFKITTEQGVALNDAATGGNTGGWIHTQQSSSYYPAAFERTIYTFPFTLQSLPVGERFSLSRVFSFRSIAAKSACVWSVIMEFGERVDDVAPGSVGPNLKAYNYLPPAVDQQVVITDVTTDHALGIGFQRTADGISGYRSLYSRSPNLIPGTTPTAKDFTLRVRVGQFDIENQIADPSGYVAYSVAANTKLPDSVG